MPHQRQAIAAQGDDALDRPDGYIGFRSQPPDAKALSSYFTRILL